MCDLHKINLDYIRNGGDPDDPTPSMQAAIHLIQVNTMPAPEFIKELEAIAADQGKREWARVAAIYCLGWVDRDGVSEPTIRPISCDPAASAKLRDYADEALYYFASTRHAKDHERDCPDAITYTGLKFREWRDAQTDLAPEDPNSTQREIERRQAKNDPVTDS